MNYLTIVHLINDIHQVVNEQTDSVLLQGSLTDCVMFLYEIQA